MEESVYQYYAEHPQEVDAEVEEFLYKSELLMQKEQQLRKMYEQEFTRRGVTPQISRGGPLGGPSLLRGINLVKLSFPKSSILREG